MNRVQNSLFFGLLVTTALTTAGQAAERPVRLSETVENLLVRATLSGNLESFSKRLRGVPDHLVYDSRQADFARDDHRTIHLSFQSLQVTQEDPSAILDEGFSGTLTVNGQGVQTAQTGPGESLPDIRLEGSLQIRNGRVVGGSVNVVQPSGLLFRCEVSAGFVLPRLVAAFCGSCPDPAPELAQEMRAPWSEGGRPVLPSPAGRSGDVPPAASESLPEL